jgi:hypothetical protein
MKHYLKTILSIKYILPVFVLYVFCDAIMWLNIPMTWKNNILGNFLICNIKETLILWRNWNIENTIIPGFNCTGSIWAVKYHWLDKSLLYTVTD